VFAFDLATGARLGETQTTGEGARLFAGQRWFHLDRTHPDAARWLTEDAGLEELVVEELTAPSTRPRLSRFGAGVLIGLRGVNLNEGAEPEDMISLRMWADETRLISLRGPRLVTVRSVRERLEADDGPRSVGELLTDLVEGLNDRIGPVVEAAVVSVDEMEARVVDPNDTPDGGELATLRQRAIVLHRYLSPQTTALTQLHRLEQPALFGKEDRRRLEEQINDATRYVEDLEALRGRASVVQDELSNQLAERANRRVYIVTIIAAIFLPLTLVSGLLGMNVGGVPLAQHSNGFWLVTGGLIAAGLIGLAVGWAARWL
jgi:zinc transporter